MPRRLAAAALAAVALLLVGLALGLGGPGAPPAAPGAGGGGSTGGGGAAGGGAQGAGRALPPEHSLEDLGRIVEGSVKSAMLAGDRIYALETVPEGDGYRVRLVVFTLSGPEAGVIELDYYEGTPCTVKKQFLFIYKVENVTPSYEIAYADESTVLVVRDCPYLESYTAERHTSNVTAFVVDPGSGAVEEYYMNTTRPRAYADGVFYMVESVVEPEEGRRYAVITAFKAGGDVVWTQVVDAGWGFNASERHRGPVDVGILRAGPWQAVLLATDVMHTVETRGNQSYTITYYKLQVIRVAPRGFEVIAETPWAPYYSVVPMSLRGWYLIALAYADSVEESPLEGPIYYSFEAGVVVLDPAEGRVLASVEGIPLAAARNTGSPLWPSIVDVGEGRIVLAAPVHADLDGRIDYAALFRSYSDGTVEWEVLLDAAEQGIPVAVKGRVVYTLTTGGTLTALPTDTWEPDYIKDFVEGLNPLALLFAPWLIVFLPFIAEPYEAPQVFVAADGEVIVIHEWKAYRVVPPGEG